jgi:hypothetical protein
VPARSGHADPPSPHLATASIHVHAIRDGELCPRGGEGHQRWLLLIAPSYRSDMGRVRGWSSARLEWLQAAVVGEEGQLPPSPPPRCHIPPYCHCGQQISFVKKISLQIYRGGGGGGRSSPVCDSHRWVGSSAVAGPSLLVGGTGPEATVVG